MSENGYEAAGNVAEGMSFDEALPVVKNMDDDDIKYVLSDDQGEQETEEQDVEDQEEQEVDPDSEEVEEEDQEPKNTQEKKKYKIVVDQEERELELGDEDVLAYIQKGVSSEEKFELAAQQKKQTQALLDALEKDPLTVLQKLGKKPEDLVDLLGPQIMPLIEQRLIEQYQRDLLPEEQRKIFDMQKENEQLKKFAEQQKQMEQQKAHTEKVNKIKTFFKQQIDEAIKTSSIEDSKELRYEIQKIAKHFLQTNNDATWADIVNLANKRVSSTRENLIKNLTPEQLRALIGDDKVKALRAKDIEDFKNGQIKKNPEAPKDPGKKQKTSKKETMEALNERLHAISS